MKIYKTQSEVEADIKDGVLAIDDDVKFECSICIEAHITAENINARNINARGINARDIDAGDIDAVDIDAVDIDAMNINAWNINAGDINAWDIDAMNITARNINAWDINAGGDIDAGDINAWNITAEDIDARDISYYAFCNVYKNITCTSITARRDPAQEPVCLDGTLEIKEPAIELTEESQKCGMYGNPESGDETIISWGPDSIKITSDYVDVNGKRYVAQPAFKVTEDFITDENGNRYIAVEALQDFINNK